MKGMIRLLFLGLLSLQITSCTNSSADPKPPKVYYSYGSKSFSGNITPLNDTYRPKNLSAKVFTLNNQTYAPMDILSQELSIEFDAQTHRTSGKALIHFRATENSAFPYFQLLAPISESQLNSVAVIMSPVTDPDGLNQSYQSVNRSLQKDEEALLEISYEIPADQLTYINGGVRFLTDMTDLYDAEFFEHWGPANFEEDEFEMSLKLKVLNSSIPHHLYTNGSVEELSPTEWKIQFPSYFTSSSFYIHLTERVMFENKFVYKGIEKDIPVTVYSATSTLVTSATNLLPQLFHEFETDFGAYPHQSFVAYMHTGGGGMEYSGATITGLPALDHELFHSWFARSVKPAEGRSGWIDEAFASWRDYSYFQAPSLLQRTPTRLSAFSPYRKSTPENCYRDGRQLIAELDRYFSEYGGMKPLMKVLFQRYKNRVITNEEFWEFLNSYTEMNVDSFFLRYTLQQSGNQQSQSDFEADSTEDSLNDSKHPMELSPEEILNLR